MGKYLDSSGVTYLWGKIKGLFTDSSLNTGAKTITGAINEINTKVNNLTGAFVWKGSFETEADKPSAATYNIGDVIGVAHKEYVCTEVNGAKTWVEFGDEANHITKDFAESTYLKNTASAVGTANLSDNAVTSAKLAVGTRNPIILTESTTEVDEETYQKLLRDDVDVVFKMNNADFLYRFTSESVGSGLMLNFSSLVAFPKKSIENVRVQGVQVTIKHTTPHTCKVFGIDSEPSLKNLIDDAKYLNKSTLTPILKEIDLTGTDAERKAKLDQFEKDWTALTGASDLSGARFVGNDADENHIVFVYDRENGCYTGYGSSDGTYPVGTKLGLDGSLTITPLFSHLEAVVLRISDGDSNADTVNAANKASIENYVANLQSLGVSIEGTPCHFILLKYKNGNYTNYTVNVGILRLTEKYSQYDFWIDGVKGGVDYETGKVTISSNLNTTLEAITIYTDNTEEHMQMNLDNIAAYEANLEALGVNQHTVPYPISLKGSESDTILYSGYITPPENGVSYAGVVWERIVSGDITNIKSVVINQDSNNGEIFIRDIAISPNEVSNYYVSKSLNAKSLEAVTIKTSNSDTGKAANVAAIKAYVNNLKSLGVDITKGYMIPVIMNGANGFVTYSGDPTSTSGLGFTRTSKYSQATIIRSDGTAQGYLMLDAVTNYYTLTTTSKQIVGAINEVNAAVKTKANSSDVSSKQDKLVSGTNIKTVNGTSLLGSGDITISGGSGDVTSAGNNTFTGNNTFKNRTYLGETLAEHLYFPGGEGYDATTIPSSYVSVFYNGPSNVLMVANKNSKAVPLSGIATPTGDEYAANKKYVDDQITAKLGTVLTQLQNI